MPWPWRALAYTTEDEKQKGLTAMTKLEAQREALAKNKERVKQVQEIKKKDPTMPIAKACNQIGWTFSQYYTTLKRLGKSPGLNKPATKVAGKKINYPAQRKAPSKLTVTEIMPLPRGQASFMLFGTPHELAEFARAYG
jgi:hypothetical protein